MRKLYIRRERALACFAIPYHCVIGQPMEEHLRWAETQDRRALMMSHENAMRSGETICLTLDDEPSSLFVIAYQERGALITEELPVPAGTEDLFFVVSTQFDGNRRLCLELSVSEPFSEEVRKQASSVAGAAGSSGQPQIRETETVSQPQRRLAVIFPGIGYTADKPLLHYSRRLAAEHGYEIRLLSYSGFPHDVRGDKGKMAECYRLALTQAEEMMADADLGAYDDVLFIGKSIGTIIAARFAAKSQARDRIRLVLFTPLQDTFVYSFGEAIAFTGADDPWVRDAAKPVTALCRDRGIPCFVVPHANHSLEVGNCGEDIRNLARIMELTERFICAESR